MSKSQILAKVSLFIIIKIPKVPKVLYSKLRTLKIDKKIALKEILKLLFLTILNN